MIILIRIKLLFEHKRKKNCYIIKSKNSVVVAPVKRKNFMIAGNKQVHRL